MIINAISELTNCPLCGKHCPIDSPSCPKGRTLVEQCGRGEAVDTDALLAQFKSEDKGEGRHGHRHDHSHGGEKHRRH